MSTLFQTVIGELAAAFTSDTRTSNGATFYVLKDDEQRWCSRTWLTRDTTREVHEAVDGPSPRLPDDWIFEQMYRVAQELHDRSPEDMDATTDMVHEIADGLVDIYTSDLLAWIGNHHNAAIADDATREGLIEQDAPIERRAAVGQYEAISRIAHALILACDREADRRAECETCGRDKRDCGACCYVERASSGSHEVSK